MPITKEKASTKELVRGVLRHLPDDCTLEDVQHELYVIQKALRGLEEIRQGKGIPHDEAKRRMKKWLSP